MFLEREVGGALFDKLVEIRRLAKVDLKHPDLTCRIEVTRGPVLIYARRIAGPGGLPPNTAGRLTCLLSGGFDSAVAAYKMMKRGAHLSFVHFWGGGAEPGESSIHVARRLLEKLVPWQGSAKLYLVPFEPLQREIVARADESFRTLLYRRLMVRIAERVALREKSKGLVTGDSLGQVASQTLRNLQAVGSIARLPLYRPLVGDDKLEIQDLAAKIGTYDISANASTIAARSSSQNPRRSLPRRNNSTSPRRNATRARSSNAVCKTHLSNASASSTESSKDTRPDTDLPLNAFRRGKTRQARPACRRYLRKV